MKVNQDIAGKRVLIKMRTGGTYSGTVTKILSSAIEMQPDIGGKVFLSNGLIASIQYLIEDEKNE